MKFTDDPLDDPEYRCLAEPFCPNLAAEGPRGVETLCASCRDGQAPVSDDAVPEHIDEETTKRIARLTDAELLAELEQHGEYGGVR
jgi:hypothetical protein